MSSSSPESSLLKELDPLKLRERIEAATGKGIQVGLLDTGVDSTHRDLHGRVVSNHEVVGEGVELEVQPRWRGVDYEEHGTACAGILHEAAPDAEIHSICVLGRMKKASLSQTLAGLEFALDQGWEVINISVGTLIFSEELIQLTERAFYTGQILIAAKDNQPDKVGYPAALSSVIGVDLDHHPGSFQFVYRPDNPVDVEAHGVYVDAPIAGGKRRAHTGTSFACPQIAALAARCREVFPNLDAPQFRMILAALSQ